MSRPVMPHHTLGEVRVPRLAYLAQLLSLILRYRGSAVGCIDPAAEAVCLGLSLLQQRGSLSSLYFAVQQHALHRT